ncbi:MAG: hypothetical protein GEU95_25305 [Rhizobiales bacterium]|nr:hypothetical protein [Hyphomicrobiales bacterium]
MDMINARPTEAAALVGVVGPANHADGAVNSNWVEMSKFESIRATVFAGVLGVAATLDAKLEQATNASGAGAKDVTGKAITQLVKATDDNKQAEINCRAEELDVNGGFGFVRLVLTVGTAASHAAAAIYGHNPRYAPASNYDLASVAEIVS